MSGNPEIPRAGTPEYRWWLAGARAEANAWKEGRSEAGLEVRELVDTLAEHRHDLGKPELAALTFEIFAAGLPFRRRLALAWQAIRPPARSEKGRH